MDFLGRHERWSLIGHGGKWLAFSTWIGPGLASLMGFWVWTSRRDRVWDITFTMYSILSDMLEGMSDSTLYFQISQSCTFQPLLHEKALNFICQPRICVSIGSCILIQLPILPISLRRAANNFQTSIQPFLSARPTCII